MKKHITCVAILLIAFLGICSASFAELPDPTPTPFKPSAKSIKILSKQLKSAFNNLDSDVADLGQSFAETLSTKRAWSGQAITGSNTGVNLTDIAVTFTPDADDITTGTWSSTPISLADLGGSSASGEWAIFGSAMYLFNIVGSSSSQATLLVTLPKPGKPVLSFQLGNISPPAFVTLK